MLNYPITDIVIKEDQSLQVALANGTVCSLSNDLSVTHSFSVIPHLAPGGILFFSFHFLIFLID